jgi:uncharacterized protein YdeI (YjbR/CyaY-like superfamily)
MPTDPRVDAYIERQGDFARPILTWLRERVHSACPDAEEGIKWGMPFFSHGGRPLANMAAFKAHASFGFWDRQGMATGKEGEAMGQFGRLQTLSDLPDASAMEELVRHAVRSLAEGNRAKRPRAAPKGEAEVPGDVLAALAQDDAARTAWDGFPPSARRDYVEWITGAKRSETRARRIVQTIDQLREGKRLHWKYEGC